MSSNGSVSVSGRGRRRYLKEFKDDAVRMVVELDKPIAAVARDLGIHEGTLGCEWKMSSRKAAAFFTRNQFQ